jgi:hypothetical protein
MSLASIFRIHGLIDHGGITLVTAGLVVASTVIVLVFLFIRWFPGMLDFLDRICVKPGQKTRDHGAPSGQDADDTIDRDIAVAIATVLERELTPEDGSAIQRITIRRNPEETLWRNAYRIRSLVTKSPPPTARK